jgi:hypothetical protein
VERALLFMKTQDIFESQLYIDDIVIGDRLYTLPIKVEGFETRAEQDGQMDVDNDNNRAGGSGDNQGGTGADISSENLKEREKNKEGSDQPRKQSHGANQTDHIQEFEVASENDKRGPVSNVRREWLQEDEENRTNGRTVEELMGFTPVPLKRSKRREHSVDENIGERAQRLKAIKDLDCPGMSKCKSFLSYSDSRINSTIDRLGVSLGTDSIHSVNHIKSIESGRLLQAALDKQTQDSKDSDTEVDVSVLAMIVILS